MRPVGSQTVAKSAEQDAPRTTYALLLLRGCGAFLAVITFSFFIYIYIYIHIHMHSVHAWQKTLVPPARLRSALSPSVQVGHKP